MSEITVKVVGPIQAGKTAIASLLDNALRANGITAKIQSDSALSYLREAKNHVPTNVSVTIIDGTTDGVREFGNSDDVIPIRGRIMGIEVQPVKYTPAEATVVALADANAFAVYRREWLNNTSLAVWVGDFHVESDAIDCANTLAEKYGTAADFLYKAGL
ncbi:hypothetical protein FDJ23_gp033 [Erwinia phage vB_EamM_Desertfox]|uniref:Uncharacterized protein n=1 Tax=Erwinia phage vB_EamM_Desertfox TaxID=2060127 RepID=A0A2H5BIK1_9CAUD|nr:hypothetical protein FDJ23_gp033 [Erwinia phage vB_EamM_Desertfox]AUG86141.1 hypothetical protein DESERTFOX_33 [Erwinia phage vB_EamM_Desertfox]